MEDGISRLNILTGETASLQNRRRSLRQGGASASCSKTGQSCNEMRQRCAAYSPRTATAFQTWFRWEHSARSAEAHPIHRHAAHHGTLFPTAPRQTTSSRRRQIRRAPSFRHNVWCGPSALPATASRQRRSRGWSLSHRGPCILMSERTVEWTTVHARFGGPRRPHPAPRGLYPPSVVRPRTRRAS